MARAVLPLACALLASTPCWSAERALGDLLTSWSRQLGVNFVLDERLSLDRVLRVDVEPDSLQALDRVLAEAGLVQRVLDNGDRLIEPGRELSLDLAALSVEGTALDESVGDTLADRVASQTRLRGDAVAAAADRELDDLYLRVANVFGSRDTFYIRGVPRSGDLNSLGNAGVFMDGVPVPAEVLAYTPIGTASVDQVRFHRGADPLGSEGPFAAYAGSIQLDHATPGFDPGGRWFTRYGHLGDAEAGVAADGVLIEDELSLRAGIAGQSLGETLNRASDGEAFDSADSFGANLAARWEPVAAPGLSVTARAFGLDARSGPQTLVQDLDASRPFSREGGVAPILRSDTRFSAASVDALYQSAATRTWSMEAGWGDSRVELDPSRPIANEILPRFELIDRTESRTGFGRIGFTQRDRRQGVWSVSVSGGETRREERVDRDQADWAVERRLRRVSAVVGLEQPLGDRLTLQGRMRRDRDALRQGCEVRGRPGAGFAEEHPLSCSRLLGFYAALPDDRALPPIDVRFTRWSPDLTATWAVSSTDRLSARIYRGHNAGGATSSVTLSGDPFWIVYQPEAAETGELSWLRDRPGFSSRLTAFYGTLENQWSPQLTGAPFPLSDVANSGRSRHYGIEWDGEWSPGEQDRIQWSLGWLSTRYVNYLPFQSDVEVIPVPGNEFPGAPEYSGSVTWRRRLDAHWEFVMVASHHARTYANADNLELAVVPAASLLDAALSYRWRSFTFRAEVRNLLDEDYLETTPRLIRNSGQVEYSPGRPRSLSLMVSRSF